MLRAVIIDDEPIGLRGLQLLLEKHCPEIKVVATSTDPEQGLALIEDYRPEVLFLDISMPRMDGFELLAKLKYHDFKLVFTTAHQEHALRAIKNKAADYLLKPVDVEELKSCVSRLLEKHGDRRRSTDAMNLVELSVKDGIIFIRQNEIIRLEASGSYTVFYLDKGVRHMASKNLKECESLLDHELFFRCHPSHLINLRKVEKLVSTDGLFIKMIDGSMAEITKKNKDVLLERLKGV